MADWTVRKPRIDYSAADSMRDLTVVALDFLNKSLDRKEKKDAYMLNILADDLRTSRGDLKRAEKEYLETKAVHKSFFGKQSGNDVDYTSKGPSVSKDIMKMHEEKIDFNETRVGEFNAKRLEMLENLSFINRLQEGLSKSSRELGDPDILESIDVTPEALAPQFSVGTKDEVLRDKELIASYFKQRPEVISPEVLKSINLLSIPEKQRQKAEEEKKEKDKTFYMINTLAKAPVTEDLMTLVRQREEGDIIEDELKELSVGLYPWKGGRTLGTVIAPEYGSAADDENKDAPYSKKERISLQFNEIVKIHNTFKKFEEGKGYDYLGLARFNHKMTIIYEGLEGENKKGFRDYLMNVFNYDVSVPERYIFEPARDFGYPKKIGKKKAKEVKTSYSVEDMIRATFSSQYSDVTEDNLNAYFYDKKNIQAHQDAYRQMHPNITDTKIADNIESIFNSIYNQGNK